MDTNSNIPAQKKVVSVEILHLDELGYGPQGKHTRRKWRAECLENLLAGKALFEAWQQSVKNQININLPAVKFVNKLTQENSSHIGFSLLDNSVSYTLDFSEYYFEDELDIQNYAIDFPINFNHSVFMKDISFSGTSFGSYVDFESCIFNGLAFFRSATFSSIARFMNSVFHQMALFPDTIFLQQAQFNGAKFLDNGQFDCAKFVEESYFENIESKFSLVFEDAKFKEANFRHSKFFYSNFRRAIFEGDANFSSAIFLNDSNFMQADFRNDCIFKNYFDDETQIWYKKTTFHKSINFENAIFRNVGHFERVRFLKFTPAFRGCKIDSTRLEFSDDSYFPEDENSDDAIKNISFLKRLAEEHGQTDQSLNFNAMELKAKRKQVEPQAAHWSFKVLTWLYEKVSDYGRSFLRPLLGYGALIVCSLLLTLPLSDYSQDTTPVAVTNRALCVPKDKEEVAKQLQLTFGRAAFEYAMFRAGGVLDFTDTGKQNNTVNCTLFGQPIEPPFMRAWGIFKGIASIALLFLAALGLRNKYRIK